MSLKVMYVEDSQSDVKALRDALRTANNGLPDWSKVILRPVSHPSELPGALSEYPDVVLADVLFLPEGAKPPAPATDHLDAIIKHVKEWDQRSPHGFPTPVIAYTGTGPATLKKCLERRGNLYDIWDKLSAGADYVAWRFQRLAAELPRYRPDATIQKLIAAMPAASSPEWHRQVLRLVKDYGAGQTEHEQVRQCRDSLQTMLDAVCTTQAVALMALWDRLVKSEPLLRAASPKLRGIARHSINVFWFGYWLINHPLLETNMRCLWTEMSGRRSDGHLLNSVDPLVGMNSVWLLASLFHDAGKFHENNKAITDVSLECSKEDSSRIIVGRD